VKKSLILIITAVVLAACSGRETQQTARGSKDGSAAPAAAPLQASMPQPMPPVGGNATVAEMGGVIMQRTQKEQIRGTVAESIASGEFTYVRLKLKRGEEWIVLPPTKLSRGADVVAETRMVAENFESRSLKRTFAKVTFANLISGGTPVETPLHAAIELVSAQPVAPAASEGQAMAAQHASAAAGPENIGPINVKKAEGADARTVAEVWGSRARLGDQNVTVRGMVVKSLSGVMGKTWIHIRDGSGTRAAGDDDLTVTTNDPVKVGDVVLVSGVVRVDKDFGAGYHYPVIIENASLKR